MTTYKGLYTGGSDYDGVVVEGDTLTIKMERPFPDMPYRAAFPAMNPIPERGSDPDRYALHPFATGPYKFADYVPGESLTLVRNEEWDPNTDPGRHAYPDRYEFDFTVAQQIDATILGDTGKGQTTVSLSEVSTEDYRRAQRLDRLLSGSGPCTNIWYPDYRKLTDQSVRVTTTERQPPRHRRRAAPGRHGWTHGSNGAINVPASMHDCRTEVTNDCRDHRVSSERSRPGSDVARVSLRHYEYPHPKHLYYDVLKRTLDDARELATVL